MWTLSRNNMKKLWLAAAALGLAASAEALPINTCSITMSSTTFTAGATNNVPGSGQFFITCITSAGAFPQTIPDAGQTVRLDLLKNGSVVTDGMSPASFTTDGSNVTYGLSSLGSLSAIFYHAGTGLVLRATPVGSGTGDDGDPFTVNPGTATKIVVLAPGQTHDPGRNPSVVTNTGKTGAGTPQEPNQTFPITVILTDNQFNKVSANHTVAFASGDLITLPSPGALSSGQADFNVTITGAKITRTITVTDQTDASVAAGTTDVTTAGPPAEEVFPFPSPFNPHTSNGMTLRFRLSEPKTVTLKVADQFGQQVWRHEAAAGIGFTDVTWNGRNDSGITVASGIYYVFLEVDGSLKSKKRIGVIK